MLLYVILSFLSRSLFLSLSLSFDIDRVMRIALLRYFVLEIFKTNTFSSLIYVWTIQSLRCTEDS